MDDVVIAAVVIGGAAIVAVVSWLGKPQCPSCGARAVRFVHQRRDGGADRRYTHNPQVCSRCGWSSAYR